MRKFLPVTFFLFLIHCAFSQNTPNVSEIHCGASLGTNALWHFNPGIAPQFPGGDSALQKYVQQKLDVPKRLQNDADGKSVEVQFNVDTTGRICNVQLLTLSGADAKLDQAAVDLCCNMPKWIPGGETADGKTCSHHLVYTMTAKISFPDRAKLAPSRMEMYRLPDFHIIPAHETAAPFTFVQVMPHFPAEQGDISQYLSKNIHYPAAEKSKKQQGTIFITFIVERDGSITCVDVSKGIPDAPGLAEEALKVIGGMPKWTPGMMNGKPVRVEMTIPIKFVLQQ